MGKKIDQLDVYDDVNTDKSRKNLFEVSKNTGTYSSPFYDTDGSRKITQEQLREELNIKEYLVNEVIGKTNGDTLEVDKINVLNLTSNATFTLPTASIAYKGKALIIIQSNVNNYKAVINGAAQGPITISDFRDVIIFNCVFNETSTYDWFAISKDDSKICNRLVVISSSTYTANANDNIQANAQSLGSDIDITIPAAGIEGRLIYVYYPSGSPSAYVVNLIGGFSATLEQLDYFLIRDNGSYWEAISTSQNVSTTPSLDEVTDVGNTTQNSIEVGGLVVDMPSGSGAATSITKGGAGEALTVSKTSGSGNVASFTGGVTSIQEAEITSATANRPAFFDSAKKLVIATGALLGTWFQTLTAKSTPVDADTIVVNDSTASFEAKRTTLLQLWTNYLLTKVQSIGYLSGSGLTTNTIPRANAGALQDSYITEITGTVGGTSGVGATRPYPTFNQSVPPSGTNSAWAGYLKYIDNGVNLGRLYIYSPYTNGQGAGWYEILTNQNTAFPVLSTASPAFGMGLSSISNSTSTLPTNLYTGEIRNLSVGGYRFGLSVFQNGGGAGFLKFEDGLSWQQSITSNFFMRDWDGIVIGSTASGGKGGGATTLRYNTNIRNSQVFFRAMTKSGVTVYIEGYFKVDGSGNITTLDITKPSENTSLFNVSINTTRIEFTGTAITNGVDFICQKVATGSWGDEQLIVGKNERYSSDGTVKYWVGDLALGSSTINASAQLDLQSTTKGFLKNRLTSAQIASISTPAQGLEAFDTDLRNTVFLPVASGNPIRTSGTMFTQTANKQVQNTITETSLVGTGVGSNTIKANSSGIGTTYRLSMWGYISNTGSPFAQVKIKIGSVTIFDTTSSGMFAITGNQNFKISALFTVRTLGASGTVIGQGEFEYATSASTQYQILFQTNTATSTIDTTIDQTVDVTFTWNTASASNSINSTNFILERL